MLCPTTARALALEELHGRPEELVDLGLVLAVLRLALEEPWPRGLVAHDAKLLAETLDSAVAGRPAPTDDAQQNLSLDKAFGSPTGREAVASREYVSHIRRIGEEKPGARKTKSLFQ